MVSRDFQALADQRAARALLLGDRYPVSREALFFYAEIVTLQARIAGSLPSNPAAGQLLAQQGRRMAGSEVEADRGFQLDALLSGRQPLVELVGEIGPGKLGGQARDYDESSCRESLRAYVTGQDTTSLRSFFARVLLQPAMFAWAATIVDANEDQSSEPAMDGNAKDEQQHSSTGEEAAAQDASRHRTTQLLSVTPLPGEARLPAASCPRCGHAPQAGCLRPQGDGAALTLVCSLCLREWPFARVRCPACGSTDHHKIGYYSTPEFAHLKIQACESCRAYLHLVDLAKEKQAIADVDELAALALDLWALENGYRKVQPNLAGI